MKKYRCPYCGEECITTYNKIYYTDYKKRQYGMKQGNPCNSCNQYYMPYTEKNVFIEFIFIIFGICLPLLFLVFSIFINKGYIVAFILCLLLDILLIIPFFNFLFAKLTQYDQEKHSHIILEPNAEVILKNVSRKINSFDIYGIRFDKKTNTIKFHEVFTNDLVPVVFYKDKNKHLDYRVTIMKSEYVPVEFLTKGSQFTVVDNGKDIARGEFI